LKYEEKIIQKREKRKFQYLLLNLILFAPRIVKIPYK